MHIMDSSSKEQVIVTLTSYGKRVSNIPLVLDTIFRQTFQPDLIVLNLAFDEFIPQDVSDYLDSHLVSINRVPDTKVYKKLIPTLIKHPQSCVISIDDDFLYPKNMISDFVKMHERYPNNPISGNKVVYFGMQCHCGCASLTKAEYFGDYLFQVNDEVINNCPSDDLLYTYFATKTGHPYLFTDNEFFVNMESINTASDQGYSINTGSDKGIIKTFDYLTNRYGHIDNIVSSYVHDEHIAKVLENIHKNILWEKESAIRSSHAYRLGKFFLRPFQVLKKR